MHYGAGHHERCGQKPAVRGAVPHLCAGWLPRGPFQKPEHGPEQLRHPQRCRDGPCSGGAGTGCRRGAGCAHEPHPAQAQQRCGQSGDRERQGPGPDVRRRLFQDEAQPYPGHSGSLQQPCRRERHHRDRRRGQPGRDQPESRRYREHGPCKAGGCAGAAGGRYRPGRRIRAAVRHCGAAGSRRACPHQGAHHQQVPGRCGDPAARPCHAGRKKRSCPCWA